MKIQYLVGDEGLSLSSPNKSNFHVPKQFQFGINRTKARLLELIFTFQMLTGKPQPG